jgi:hypothetical protein
MGEQVNTPKPSRGSKLKPEADPSGLDENKKLPFADAAAAYGAFIAPLTLALSGTFYLAGFYYVSEKVDRFGLRVGMFDLSVQTFLAVGFLPSIIPLPFIAVIAWLMWSRSPLARRLRHPTGVIGFDRAGRFHPGTDLGKRVVMTARTGFVEGDRWTQIRRIVSYGVWATTILSYGFVVGIAYGWYIAYFTRTNVSAGCPLSCFVYTTEKQQLVGRIIVQDSHRTALHTLNGTVVIDTADIRAVAPFSPRRATSK